MSDLTLTPSAQTGGTALVAGPGRALKPSPETSNRHLPIRRPEELVSVTCLLLALCADLALLRIGLDAEDEGYFVEQATRVLRGQIPFRDFDSLYTPALLYVHAAAVALLGGSPIIDVRLVGWLARVVLAVVLYFVCRKMTRPAIAMLPSLYTLIALDRLPSTWEPHPGWPSVALTVVAIGAAVRLPTLRRSLMLVAIGAVAALVFALKQNAGVLLGLALVMNTAWLGLDATRTDVTRGLRTVQFGLLGVLMAATAWLLRPHASPVLVAYFAVPLLAASLAAIVPVRVSTTGRSVGAWLRILGWLGLGWSIVSAPWLIALLAALDWNVLLVKGFVGLVNQDVLWYPPTLPSGGGWASLLGIVVALLAIVRWRKQRVLRVCGVVSLVVFGACLIELTRGPDDSLAVAMLLAPGRASESMALFLPGICILGGVWLSSRTASEREAWWLRWMAVASAVTFLTEYPRVDEVHLTWSACLALATGAVVLPRLYAYLVRRWQAGASRYLVALALLVLPVATGLRSIGVRAAGFADLAGPAVALVRLAPTVTASNVPAAAGIVVSAHEDATLLGVARYVAANTAPGEPIFVYPTSPLVYVLADRPNPTRFTHLYPNAATPAELDQVIATLADTPVNVLVVSEADLAFWGAPLDNATLETYLAGAYREIASFGAYRVLRRN